MCGVKVTLYIKISYVEVPSLRLSGDVVVIVRSMGGETLVSQLLVGVLLFIHIASIRNIVN